MLQKKWSNNSGKALSSTDWLYEHHLAKLPERVEFIKKLLTDFKPKIIVDLGCGIGLWLEIIKDYIDDDCQLIGIDTDINAINEANERSKIWNKKISFIHCDFIKSHENIPKADLFLAFNIFSYINDTDLFVENLRNKLNTNGKLVIRQYDGAAIRFGPMCNQLRINVENTLFNSINNSQIFKHYNLDRIYETIDNSKFGQKEIDFELFYKSSPFPNDFIRYYKNTIKWTINYLSESMKKELTNWYNTYLEGDKNSYFYEVDLVIFLTH